MLTGLEFTNILFELLDSLSESCSLVSFWNPLHEPNENTELPWHDTMADRDPPFLLDSSG